ncbi:sensor histidine kinase [Nigerium massiliense]|uniref:sensor histidine kinase n=1 Tax=Nigerium massiliense TaxID=1522317 RepID=UPI0005900C18|nr:ATP-binding protein [Nigerium massiliense]
MTRQARVLGRASGAAAVAACWCTWFLGAFALDVDRSTPALVGVTVGFLGVLMLLLIATTVLYHRRPSSRIGLQVYSIVTFIGCLTMLFFADHLPPAELPALAYVFVAPLGASCYIFGRRGSHLAALIGGPLYGLFSWVAFRDLTMAILDALFISSIVVAVCSLWELTRKVMAGMTASADRQVVLGEPIARRTRRLYERRRWDGLMHDKVLGALQLGYREGESSANARALAVEALRALESVEADRSADSVEDITRQTALRLGLDVTFTRQGYLYETEVTQTVGAAVAEALTNVARHAGTDRASVELIRHDHTVTVRVRDEGRGFDSRKTGVGRAGLRVGVFERMASVGGEAHIDSAPGRGTVVTLIWRDQPLCDPPTVSWDDRQLRPALWSALALSGTAMLAGFVHPEGVRNLGILAAGSAVIVLVTVCALAIRRSRWAAASALALIPLPWLFTANLSTSVPLDNRYFWGGAMTAVLAVLSYRSGRWVSPAILWSAVVVDVVAQLAVFGAVRPGVLLYNYTLPVVAVTLCTLMRVALDRLKEMLVLSAKQASDLHLATVADEEARSEAQLRRERLTVDVVPKLRMLAAGGPISPAERAELVIVEASTRDWLVAAPVMTESLECELRHARRRGVRLRLTAKDSGLPQERAQFRSVLSAALSSADGASEVTAQWNPQGDRRGTITVINPVRGDVDARLDEAASQARGALAVKVSADEDAVLVELQAPRDTAADGHLPLGPADVVRAS